jgi:hypothetical protein
MNQPMNRTIPKNLPSWLRDRAPNPGEPAPKAIDPVDEFLGLIDAHMKALASFDQKLDLLSTETKTLLSN